MPGHCRPAPTPGLGTRSPAYLAHFHHTRQEDAATTITPAPVAEPVPTPETAAAPPSSVPAATTALPPAEVPIVIEVPSFAPPRPSPRCLLPAPRAALPAALLSAARRIAETHPAWARRSSPELPPRTSAPDSTSSAPPASAAHTASMLGATSPAAAPPASAATSCSSRRRSPAPLHAQVSPEARRTRGGDPAQCPHRHVKAPALRTPHCRRNPPVPRERARTAVASVVRTRPLYRTPQGRTPRSAPGRPRPQTRAPPPPPHLPVHQRRRAHRTADEAPGLRMPHRPYHPLFPAAEALPRAAARTRGFRHHLAERRACVRHGAGPTDRPDQPHPRPHHAPP